MHFLAALRSYAPVNTPDYYGRFPANVRFVEPIREERSVAFGADRRTAGALPRHVALYLCRLSAMLLSVGLHQRRVLLVG